MCLNAFFPKPPEPSTPPPTATPPPTIEPLKPKIRQLIDAKKLAGVTYGSQKKRDRTTPRVTADSLKINLGGTPPASQTGGLNNA